MAAFRLIGRPLPIHFALLGRKQKYIKSKMTAKFFRGKNIDRRGQRHIVNVWHLSDPPSFSLPTTFKREHSALKKLRLIPFFYFYGLFLPFWIRIRIRIANPDLDLYPGTPLNPEPNRIHNTDIDTIRETYPGT